MRREGKAREDDLTRSAESRRKTRRSTQKAKVETHGDSGGRLAFGRSEWGFREKSTSTSYSVRRGAVFIMDSKQRAMCSQEKWAFTISKR